MKTVPAAPVIKHVRAWMKSADMTIELASSLLSVNHHTLNGESSTLLFDTADRLLCATVGPDAWIEDPELRDLYETIDLAGNTIGKRCERKGCSNLVVPKPRAVKGRKRFCCKNCQQAALRVKWGKVQIPYVTRRYADTFTCGHPRTDENTIGVKQPRCRICDNARCRDYYRRAA